MEIGRFQLRMDLSRQIDSGRNFAFPKSAREIKVSTANVIAFVIANEFKCSGLGYGGSQMDQNGPHQELRMLVIAKGRKSQLEREEPGP